MGFFESLTELKRWLKGKFILKTSKRHLLPASFSI